LAILPSIAAILLVFDQYMGANVCFAVTALFILAKIAHVAIVSRDAPLSRFLFVFLLFGIVGVGLVETVRGVNNWKKSKEPPPVAASTAKESPPAVNPPNTETHGATDTVDAKPRRHGTTDKVAAVKVDRAQKEEQPQPPQTIIQVAPTFGNIKERAIQLADDIMRDLYRHGWGGGSGLEREFVVQHYPEPQDRKGQVEWTHFRTAYFRFRFRDRVIGIRDEFVQLHLRNQELDRFLDSEKGYEEWEKKMPTAVPDLLPQEIQEVAEQLRSLAEKVPQK
jgi:hypothetical protein